WGIGRRLAMNTIESTNYAAELPGAGAPSTSQPSDPSQSQGKQGGAPAKAESGRVLGCLAAGDGADDEKGFAPLDHGLRQRMIGRFERPIFAAGKETQEGPALLGIVVADGAAQHGIAGLERVEDGLPSDLD